MSRTLIIAMAVAACLCSVFALSATAARNQGGGQGRGQTLALPDGPGKDIVQARCTKCHALGLLARSGGYTRQGWEELLSTMVALPKDQTAEVAEYLARNFPEQPRPPAVVIPGPVTVTIKEWAVPTLGSRPHDPEPGPGGTIWWTGMFANVLGRFDPRTGEFKE
jgi:virginiamycin B lyase